LGNALGIAILGVLFTRQVEASLAASGVGAGIPGFANAVSGGGAPALLAAEPPSDRAMVADAIKAGFATGLNHVFVVAAVIAFAGAAAAWFITAPAGPPQRRDNLPMRVDSVGSAS
jgi:hypothetical protein